MPKASSRFYQGDPDAVDLRSVYLEPLTDIESGDIAPAYRAMAGQALRSEVYGVDDDGRRHADPYEITRSSYAVRQLQPSFDEHQPVHFAYAREQVRMVYEQEATDPRIDHHLALQVDGYGNTKLAASIAYPRLSATALPEQQQVFASAQQTDLVNFDELGRYELGIVIQSRGFELGGLVLASDNRRLSYEDVESFLSAALLDQISFDESFSGRPQASLSQWSQNFYWNDSQSDVLALGTVGNVTLLHHTEAACFNDDFLRSALDTHYQFSASRRRWLHKSGLVLVARRCPFQL